MSRIFSVAELKQFTAALKELGVSENVLNFLIDKNATDSPAQFMQRLASLYEQTANVSPKADAAWMKLFSSDNFNEALKQTVMNQWTVTPEEVAQKKNIEDLYRRLNTQAKQLTDYLQDAVGNGSSAFRSSQNMSQNLDFMNQLNQMYAYVQLPLKMSGNEAHGDLYVYSNKKNMAHSDGTVSALLHLDMTHLGPLDVYVKMNENKVSTNFYLADENAMDLIEEHMDELTGRLRSRGYDCTCRILQSGEDSSEDAPVDELLKLGSKMEMISSSSFDARA
jgi:flagellar hook-length control protein FliK